MVNMAPRMHPADGLLLGTMQHPEPQQIKICSAVHDSVGAVPAVTAAVARAAFPRGNVYLAMRDLLGTLFTDHDFIALFPQRGQLAYAPWRLALVTVMQFAEGLSDRHAADAVRARSTGNTR